MIGLYTLNGLEDSRSREEPPLGRLVQSWMIENDRNPAAEGLPICQDTAMVIVVVELG